MCESRKEGLACVRACVGKFERVCTQLNSTNQFTQPVIIQPTTNPARTRPATYHHLTLTLGERVDDPVLFQILAELLLLAVGRLSTSKCSAVPCSVVQGCVDVGMGCERAQLPANPHRLTRPDRSRIAIGAHAPSQVHMKNHEACVQPALQPSFNKPPSHSFLPRQIPHTMPTNPTSKPHTNTYRVAHRGCSICDVMRRPCCCVLADACSDCSQTSLLAAGGPFRSEASFPRLPACADAYESIDWPA